MRRARGLLLIGILCTAIGSSAGACNSSIIPGLASAFQLTSFTKRMQVLVEGQEYVYDASCIRSWASGSVSCGLGVRLDTAGSDEELWPATNPRLDLSLTMRGFPLADGLPPNTVLDLGSPDSAGTIGVVIGISEPESTSVIVGENHEVRWARYASVRDVTSIACDWTHIAGSEGRVTIDRFSPLASGGDIWQTDITLDNVVLQKVDTNEEAGAEIWPAAITIISAQLRAEQNGESSNGCS